MYLNLSLKAEVMSHSYTTLQFTTYFCLAGELPLPVIKMVTKGAKVNLANCASFYTGFTLPSNVGDLGYTEELDLANCFLTGLPACILYRRKMYLFSPNWVAPVVLPLKLEMVEPVQPPLIFCSFDLIL